MNNSKENNTNKDRERWENPYISLIPNMSQYIISGSNNGITSTDKEFIQQKVSEFNKTYCEIGSGSGAHIVELARLNPDVLCIGFEIRFKRAYKTAEKAERQGLKNLMVIRVSAVFIPQIFSLNSLSGIYINFPDPWSKKRWLKNRIINNDFLTKLKEVLKPQAFLSYKTDHREYFLSSAELVSNLDFLEVPEYTEDLYNSEFLETNIKTEFESLFLSQAKPIHYLKAIYK